MIDSLEHALPSLGIVALITLWVFLMLVGGSYFHRYVPEVSGPGQWNRAFVRLGMVLVMGIIGVLVAERQGLPREYQVWVGLAGGALGLVAERVWRKVDARMRRHDGRGSR